MGGCCDVEVIMRWSGRLPSIRLPYLSDYPCQYVIPQKDWICAIAASPNKNTRYALLQRRLVGLDMRYCGAIQREDRICAIRRGRSILCACLH